MIPKIIMQTWKNNNVPDVWKEGQYSMQTMFPGWTYVFMTDDDNIAFVRKHFPEHERAFIALPYAIQRADIIRYMWLYVHGGLYVDLDYHVLRPFDHLLENDASLILLHSGNITWVLTNSIIAARPRQCVFLSIISQGLYGKLPWFAHGKHMHVMFSTGPMAFHHEIVNSKTAYTVLPRNLFLPRAEGEDNYMKILPGGTWNNIDSFVFNFALQYKAELACAVGAMILYFARGFLQYKQKVAFLLRTISKLKRNQK